MSKIFRLCLAAAAAASLAGVAAPAPDDSKALQGVWKPVKGELAGEPTPDELLKTITLTLHEGDYEVTVTGKAESDTGTWAISSAVKPKGMTIKSLKGPNAGKTFPAIYELKGDRLRICYDLSGANRPAEFKTSPGTSLFLATYERQKK